MSIRVLLFRLVQVALISATVSLTSQASASPFGINGCSWSHLGMNTEKFDRETGLKRLKAIKEAGIKWDRCDFWWGRIEPEKGKFLWRDVDWVVEQYVKHDVELMPILCYGSAWQKSDAPVTDEERELFARFVYETVKRYKKHVHVWEIWNEPNITPFWAPNPDVAEYAKLLKVAYEAAKRADPNCTVVGAATAGTDFAFIEGLLLAGGGEYMDVVSIHPYQGDLGSLSPDKGGLAEQIRGVQKLLAEHGYRKPIWLTEIGHRTTGTHGHTSVTEEQQAAYLVRTYAIALASGAERVFWFNLQDWEEYWGIIRQDFTRKPSFEAYRTMVKQLEGMRIVGRADLGKDIEAYLFAPQGREPTPKNAVLVVWQPEEQTAPLPLKTTEARHVTMKPVFLNDLQDSDFVMQWVKPLPGSPPPTKRKHADLKPPPLPEMASPWHVQDAAWRVVVAAEFAEPIRTVTPLVIPNDRMPTKLYPRELFEVYDASDDTDLRAGVAERDLDGNVVLLVHPAIPARRFFYLYPSDRAPAAPAESRGHVDNGRLRVELPQGKYVASIRLKNGYTSRGDETSGIFSASYQDTAGAWPRTDASARVVGQKAHDGAVLKQHRSRITFGKDECAYEFTVTLYDGLPRVTYTGRWISPGKGATKQVNLGDSFPAGTVVTGMYGGATLPSAGVGYGPACVIRPSDHPTVTAVMVSNSGRLNTPGWATRSVVGAGLFYQTSFPATVSAEYFWYDKVPEGDLSQVAREHYLRCAIPPAISVGPAETKSDRR